MCDPTKYTMSRSILIVDDASILAEAIADMLRMEGFKAAVASHGAEALAVLEHEGHDLIISDLRMPVMDGIEFIKQVRKRSALQSTPIIVLSAQGDEYSKLQSIEAGADLFLVKPVDEPNLLHSIKQLLNIRESMS